MVAGTFAACSSGSPASPAAPEDASTNSDVSVPGDDAALEGAPAAEGATPDAGIADAPPEADAISMDAGPCGVTGPQGEPGELSCTGLYSDWATKTIATGVVEYAPAYPLWSDGAQKTRWIQLPAGQKIDTSSMDEWTFPVGTKIWKEFRLPLGDASAPVRIETRLLWKLGPSNWVRTTYRWSADGETSAAELMTGELDANGAGYEVPNAYECNQCHNGRLDGVLGFEAVSLAAPGATGLTMSKLESMGLITDAPDASLVVPGDAVAAAALGWMHMNCGTSCHNRGNGLGDNTGFYTRLDVATLSTVQTTDTYATGWNQTTEGFDLPDASTTYRFHACDLGSSAAYVRADTRDGVNGAPTGIQMPPIDSHAIDDAGVAQMAAWINAGCDGG